MPAPMPTFVALPAPFLPRPPQQSTSLHRRRPYTMRHPSPADEDFFLPHGDAPRLGVPSRSPHPKPATVAQRRAAAKRRDILSRAPDLVPPPEDEDERRRVQLAAEELSSSDLSTADLLGNSDSTSSVPPVSPSPSATSELTPITTTPKPPSSQRRRPKPPSPSPSTPSSLRTQPMASTPRPGDLVMHTRHGIGRFRGVERTVSSTSSSHLTVSSPRPTQEFAVIEYRDGDVYVPFSHFECLRCLTPAEAAVSTRLDSITSDSGYPGHSANTKNRRSKHVARVKTRDKIRKQLVNLHALYAQRTTIERDPFPANLAAEKSFAATCSFELTPDQETATQRVLNDMTNTRRPMDRLLCGDVGFGKTEVAIRASFRALLAGKQVAVLAPTTILAQQHFETFRQRLTQACPEFPLACLTRFVPRKIIVESREKITSGEIRIAVGTHMLLSDTFVFHDIGLLIVDEEHRFGVNQKEKIRSRYRGIDTLFLSATPIPRTLHLALSGLRDASVLRTPPAGRKPVITKVSPIGSGVVRLAIGRELKRGGQVFFVVPRIEGIEATANWLRDLFPKLRILVAHGSVSDLEQRIWSFAQRKFDVLVCTTIIENGINMPDVNTIVIQDAGKFGLAQLHQLRGRVGRCDVQAYALLLYRQAHISQSKQAIDRLKALEKYSDLGSGFAIAQRDMEMRGVGTILGVEQHGNSTVQPDEYAKMLAEELEHARTGNPIPITLPDPVQITEIFLPIAALIPLEYISDFDQKMTAYGQLSAAKTCDALSAVVDNLEQQYGPLPSSTRQHVSLLELKLFAKPLGITRIFTERQHVTLDWPVEEAAYKRLLAFIPDEQSRNRCELLADEERLVLRGLGICSGDVQLAKLRLYLGFFSKAAAGLIREKKATREREPDPDTLLKSLKSIQERT